MSSSSAGLPRTDPNKRIAYALAVSLRDDPVGELARMVLDYRQIPQAEIANKSTINVAAIAFFIAGGERISDVNSSGGLRDATGGNDPGGHGERRALAVLINQAIERQWGPFKGFRTDDKINEDDGQISLKYDDFNKFIPAFKQLENVTLFSEIRPCGDSNRELGTMRCNQLFEKLFIIDSNIKYSSNYVIEMNRRGAMEFELGVELKRANEVYTRIKPLLDERNKLILKSKDLSSEMTTTRAGSASAAENANPEGSQKKLLQQKKDIAKRLQDIAKELEAIENEQRRTYDQPLRQNAALSSGSGGGGGGGGATAVPLPTGAGNRNAAADAADLRLAASGELKVSAERQAQKDSASAAAAGAAAASPMDSAMDIDSAPPIESDDAAARAIHNDSTVSNSRKRKPSNVAATISPNAASGGAAADTQASQFASLGAAYRSLGSGGGGAMAEENHSLPMVFEPVAGPPAAGPGGSIRELSAAQDNNPNASAVANDTNSGSENPAKKRKGPPRPGGGGDGDN